MSYKYSVVFVDPTPGLKVLPPGPNNQPFPGAQTLVNSGALQAWEQACGQQAALDANAVLAQEYLTTAFPDWYTQYMGHSTNPDEAPPQPPAGAMVQVQSNGIGWDLIQTGPPVCSVPPYIKVRAQQTPTEAKAMLDTVGGPNPFSVATPINKVVTASDGSVWVRIQ